MAKIILLCSRNSGPDPSFPRNFQGLCRRLAPDNISPRPPLIIQKDGIEVGVFNPCASLAVQNQSVCMGNLIQPREDWWEPRAGLPDGTYALFRTDRETVEAATDMLATRTIWYVQTEDTFMASTSQRAILYFLRGFRPNTDTFTWMLSSGTLGPGLSWDSRIKCLPDNSRLILDRSTWNLSVYQNDVTFAPLAIPEAEHEQQLKETIGQVFQGLGLDYAKWALALSGGIDSRAILLFLKDRKNLTCITWGMASSLEDKKNDAFLARKIAQHFGCPHRFFPVALSGEPFDSIFQRFLVTSEGRIDQIAGYMDGFKIWKHLHEAGYEGILRGDVAFGNRAVSTPKDVYKNVGLDILSDFENLSPVGSVLEDLGQKRPSWLEQGEEENLEKWRDRLNAQFEVPVQFAALNDIKLSFVEIINPFLTHQIVQRVRHLPDSLRTDKMLFKKIVDSLNPRIPYAQRRAIAFPHDTLKKKEAVRFITDELLTQHAKALLPEALMRFIIDNMRVSDGKITVKSPLLHRMLRPLAPKSLRKWRKAKMAKRHLDLNTLGLRACIVSRMTKLLAEDARALS
jgi:hypothetical protein